MNNRRLVNSALEFHEDLAIVTADPKFYKGVAGLGLVSLIIDGLGCIKSISIDPSILAPTEQSVVQDLIVEAYRSARNKVVKHHRDLVYQNVACDLVEN